MGRGARADLRPSQCPLVASAIFPRRAEAFGWYLARSPQAAETFVRELEHAAMLRAETPGVWPLYERESRRYVLGRFPFDIIYRESGDAIDVIALAHHKRKPGYWHGRTAG